MPILGFMLACTVILAAGLFGISAVLNAPPVSQANSAAPISVAVTREDIAERSKKDSDAFAARRARLAESLKSPVVVKRETDEAVSASDQPAADHEAATPDKPIAKGAGFQTATATEPPAQNTLAQSAPAHSATEQFLGRIMSIPPSASAADATPAKTEATPAKPDAPSMKAEEAPAKAVADVAPERAPAAKDKRKEHAAKDATREAAKQSAKRRAVAKRGPIPSKEELDELIGFVPSPSQQYVVYRTIE